MDAVLTQAFPKLQEVANTPLPYVIRVDVGSSSSRSKRQQRAFVLIAGDCDVNMIDQLRLAIEQVLQDEGGTYKDTPVSVYRCTCSGQTEALIECPCCTDERLRKYMRALEQHTGIEVVDSSPMPRKMFESHFRIPLRV